MTDSTERKSQNGMDLDFLNKAASLSTVATVVLTVLAALTGVAAWYFGGKASDAKDAELERFKAESAASISASDSKSEQAKEGTARALADVAVATKGAEEAKERATRTALDLETQRERAAKAEQSLLELNRQLAPRRLDLATLSAFRSALRDAKSKGTITIEFPASDADSTELAMQISEALSASPGWGSRPNAVTSGGGPAIGISLTIHTSLTADTSFGNAFESALKATGLKFSARNDPGDGEGSVQLTVGVKPAMQTLSRE